MTPGQKNAGVTGVDYVKIDVQGVDFQVLKGMGDFIDSVKIIKIEVWFNEKEYENTTLFHEVMGYLLQRGMRLHNFPFLLHEPMNKLIWGDAIFVNKNI